MSCCGKNRARIPTTIKTSTRELRPLAPARALQSASPTVLVEYRGSSARTLQGPVTGSTYFFAHAGAQLALDIRDRSLTQTVATLRLVRG